MLLASIRAALGTGSIDSTLSLACAMVAASSARAAEPTPASSCGRRREVISLAPIATVATKDDAD